MFSGAFSGPAGTFNPLRQKHTPPGRIVPQNMANTGGMLISFDDGGVDAYTVSYPLFAAHNIPATCYINSGLTAATTLTVTMMRELHAAGWCMANHTADHLHLNTLTQAQVEAQVQETINDLTGWGLPDNALHVGYPFGEQGATVRTALAARGALTGRTIVEQQFTLPIADIYQIPARVVAAATPLATVKGYLDSALANDTICYLYFHVIKAEGELDTWDWAYSNLEALVDYIVQIDIPVLTIADLYAVQSGPRLIRQQY